MPTNNDNNSDDKSSSHDDDRNKNPSDRGTLAEAKSIVAYPAGRDKKKRDTTPGDKSRDSRPQNTTTSILADEKQNIAMPRAHRILKSKKDVPTVEDEQVPMPGAVGVSRQDSTEPEATRGRRKLAKLQGEGRANRIHTVDESSSDNRNEPDRDRGQRKLGKLRGKATQPSNTTTIVPGPTRTHTRREWWQRRLSKMRSFFRNSRNRPVTESEPDIDVEEISQESLTIEEPTTDAHAASRSVATQPQAGLAVAALVTSQRHVALPQAVQDQHQALETARRKKTKRQMLIFVALGLLLLMVLVVAAAVLARNRKGKPTEVLQSRPPPKDDPDSLFDGQVKAEDHVYTFLPKWAREKVDLWKNAKNAKTVDPDLLRSPLVQAFRWLTRDPKVRSYTQWEVRQRLALASLYYSTDGENWKRNDHWLDYNVPECQWFSKSSLFIGSEPTRSKTSYVPENDGPCNDRGHYENIWLWGNGLNGGLPRQLFWLTFLRSVTLDDDDEKKHVSGAIPSEVVDCPNLQVLSIANGRINSGISHLMQLKSLDYLRLDFNSLKGVLDLDATANWQRLRYLNLQGNSLQGPIPYWVENLVNLHELDLSHNALWGALPDIGRLSSIQTLDLASNELSGTISWTLGNLTSLLHLDLSQNQLSGSLPSAISMAVNLRYVSIASNTVTGTLPLEIAKLSNLIHLDVSQNQMTSYLPSEIGLLDKLWLFSADGNQISGSIPTETGNLHLLHSLQLSSNQLIGPMPSELGMLTMLTALELFDNGLTGDVPSQLGRLQSLESLDLFPNEMTGEVPCEVWQLIPTLGVPINGSQNSRPFQWAYSKWANPLRLEACGNTTGRPTLPFQVGLQDKTQCFSASMTVQVKGKGTVPMNELQVGDSVLVAGSSNPEFEPVYAFGHHQPKKPAEFLVFHTTTGNKEEEVLPLEVTSKHLLFLFGQHKAVTAESVGVGDVLQGAQTTKAMMVTKIESVWKTGLYAPLTSSGHLVVNGHRVSAYVALLDLAPKYQHQVIHGLLFPMRTICRWDISSQVCSPNFNLWNGMPFYIAFGAYLAETINHQQGKITQVLALAPVLMAAYAVPLLFIILILLLLLITCAAPQSKDKERAATL